MLFKRYLLCLVALFSTLTIHLIAQNQTRKTMITSYESLWSGVNEAENSSLPQTAADNVEKIYQQALLEKNSPELIKALIHKIKYESIINHDSIPGLLSDIEKYTKADPDVIEQSMLYSVQAQLYFKYFQTKSYVINQRTAVVGYLPEDIREWSGNIFIQKILENVNLSLKAEKELQSADILKYEKILTLGESSRDFRPTMYDFLANEGISLLTTLSYLRPDRFFPQSLFRDSRYLVPVAEFVNLQLLAEPTDLTMQSLKIYQNLLTFRLKQKKNEATLLADLDRLDYVNSKMENQEQTKSYIQALENLENQYQGQDICVEILYKKAICYQSLRETDEETDLSENTADISADKFTEREKNKAKAYQICKDGISKYANYKRIGLLVNLERRLTFPYVNITGDNNVYPGESLKLSIKYQNVSKLVLEIYPKNTLPDAYGNNSTQNIRKGKPIETKTFSLKNEYPYITSDEVLELPMKILGGYEYVIYADNNRDVVASNYFSVSKLTSVSRAYNNKYEFLVVDRLSGKPVEGAKVNLYKRVRNENKFQTSVVTGKDGLASSTLDEKNRMDFYSVVFGSDTALMLSSVPWSNSYQMNRNTEARVDIFTDRSIYRPGQTVYFKGIAYSFNKDSEQVTQNQKYTLFLKDPNGQEVATKVLQTNDMGSFSGEFILPYGTVNGSFSISSKDGVAFSYFPVE